jgi:hypothetical protein
MVKDAGFAVKSYKGRGLEVDGTLYPILYTLYHIPVTLYPISYTLYPMPKTLYHVPYS